MADSNLDRIRQLILTQEYELSVHVADRIIAGEFDELGIESAILKGSITRRQHDELKQSIDGYKYVISGPDRYGLAFQTVGKIIEYHDGRTYFLISAYKER